MKALKQLSILLALTLFTNIHAQEIDKSKRADIYAASEEYVWPTEPEVLEKLDQWRDLKFGVIFHWGIYAVPGIMESWFLCSEDRFVNLRKEVYPDSEYDSFKRWYWDLSKLFNPVDFNPKEWADIMKDAGMKYMIFTTKHHDGFCMFDTKETDFSIANTPFKNNPLKDITYHVFDAFRNNGFMVGAYFSKPDWHYPYYWRRDRATPDRNMNYKIEEHPEWWEKYRQFTANQINELTTQYGSLDILWLDGGWVCPKEGQDIRLREIIDDARKHQPGMLAVDRTVTGKYENYTTPEWEIPGKRLDYPWESCITLTDHWSWTPNAPYKSASQILSYLIKITAKGGALLLGVGPTPQGTIEEKAVGILREVGQWLKKNGKAIYNTRAASNYNSGDVWFTADKNGSTLYAIYALPEGKELPKTIEWEGNEPKGAIRILDGNRKVNYTYRNGKVVITLPKGLKNEPLAFTFEKK